MQAKGRVERANLTLQDRLVKEMRLQGIDSQYLACSMLSLILTIALPSPLNSQKTCTEKFEKPNKNWMIFSVGKG
ncbi:hypothetical protein DC859_18300 [Vibrio parahaemolyticus]|nr:hypothetical protein [Vibrio parahaemolyticus]